MHALTCNCGYKTQGEDRYRVEAEMWAHAIKDHGEMLRAMTTDQIAQWLRDTDAKLAAGAR